MRNLLIDLRLALRTLSKARGFAATVIVTLAVGMTLWATTFAVFNAYVLHELPYPAADRLYWVRYSAPGQDEPQDMERLDWTSLNDIIDHPIAWDLDVFYLLGGENAEAIPGAWVTPGFVHGLGIAPAIGHGFDADAFAPGGANVALISDRLWKTRFGGDPNIVGHAFTAYVSDRPEEAERYIVVGVMPPGFWHINSYTDILAPLRAPTYPYMIRLREGVDPRTAAVRITALVKNGARGVPSNWQANVTSTREVYLARLRPTLRAVTTAAVLVLLVACANVAGLLLVRATARQKEVAVRAALGAGRGALARLLMAEALVLGAASTTIALGGTRIVIDWLAPVVQQQLGRSAPGGTGAFVIEVRLALAISAVGLLSAIGCAIAPIATTMRPRLVAVLQSASRAATESRSTRRLRSSLIVVEVAASLALTVGACLMVRTVVRLVNTDLGFTAERTLTASITLRQSRYPDAAARQRLYDRELVRLRSIPGVDSAALATSWPLQQYRTRPIEAVQGSGRTTFRAAVDAVSDAYFTTLRIPVAAGRAFTGSDRAGAEAVAIVSDTLARRFWPKGNAIGERILVPTEDDDGQPSPAVVRSIVGVVQDVRQSAPDDDLMDVYVPLLQAAGRFSIAFVRTSGAPSDWIPPLRAAFRDLDPEISVSRATALQTALDEAVSGPRFLARLLACVASSAVLLALIGLYGVMAYAVRQREREIAIRLAIGADSTRITRLFVRQGSIVLLAGLVLGIAGALSAGRLLESQLVGVRPRDPISLAIAFGGFGVAGLLAVWWPARRAAAIDPARALLME